MLETKRGNIWTSTWHMRRQGRFGSCLRSYFNYRSRYSYLFNRHFPLKKVIHIFFVERSWNNLSTYVQGSYASETMFWNKECKSQILNLTISKWYSFKYITFLSSKMNLISFWKGNSAYFDMKPCKTPFKGNKLSFEDNWSHGSVLWKGAGFCKHVVLRRSFAVFINCITWKQWCFLITVYQEFMYYLILPWVS